MTEPRTVRVVCPDCDDEGHVDLSYEMGPNDPPENDCSRCGGTCEFSATLLPLAGGPVVVEKGNMEVAREKLYSLAYELVECGGDVTDGDVLRILTVLWRTTLGRGDTIHIKRAEAKP